MSQPLLTIEQAARQLQVHPYTLRRWVREGKIAAVKISRHYRISPDALQPAAQSFVDEAPKVLKGEERRAAIARLKGKYPSTGGGSVERLIDERRAEVAHETAAYKARQVSS